MTSALLTDRYELTMVQAALKSGKASRNCVFEVFSRQLPPGRRYGVVAGTGRVLEAVRDFRFDQSDLDFLEANQVVDSETLDWLAAYKFSGTITGYSEGELYFGHSPILTVEGSFAEAVILETVILSILNYDSAIASAAARMKIAAGDRTLNEMGSRRAQEQAAVAAARAAYITGFSATSNLQAGKKWGIPTMGTSAHSFTLLHDSEEEAFRAQIDSMGPETTLLVDTYDVHNAVAIAVKLTDGKLRAVRIDSGDLAATAIAVRQQLDQLGANSTKITVTSDLDEYTIAALAAAPVDSYGVGTSLVTGSGYPTAGFVYKLVSHQSGDQWVDVAKKSAQKSNRGGKKTAHRIIENGTAISELIGDQTKGRPLQVPLVVKGEIDSSLLGKNSVLLARDVHKSAMDELAPEAKRLSKGEPAIPTEFI